jgi:hypothetical protein
MPAAFDFVELKVNFVEGFAVQWLMPFYGLGLLARRLIGLKP